MKQFARTLATLTLGFSVYASAEAVPHMYGQVAAEQGVPADIFYALVLAESQSKTQQGFKPWPWTINYKGHPHFFQTRSEAYAFASHLNDIGEQLFDIGLAQVNWRWHKDRFGYDLWSAFDPYTNLTAAAQHLREQYERDECNNWAIAIGCYHRPGRRDSDIKIAERYANRVIDIWESKFM